MAEKPDHRPFDVLDLTLLVGFSVGSHAFLSHSVRVIEEGAASDQETWAPEDRFGFVAGVVLTTLALLVLCWRMRRRTRQVEEHASSPVGSTPLTVLTVVVVQSAGWVSHLVRGAARGPLQPLLELLNLVVRAAEPATIAAAVITVWTVQAVAGRWRRPADWIDWAESALGTGCLATVIVQQAIAYHG